MTTTFENCPGYQREAQKKEKSAILIIIQVSCLTFYVILYSTDHGGPKESTSLLMTEVHH